MDYVCEVLGKQGWERCKCINDYMAGWESLIDDTPTSLLGEGCRIARPTKETACQTPPEWSNLQEPEKAQEAAPESAPVRLVVLRPGT